MNSSFLVRAGGALLLAVGLSGCIDMSFDVEVLGDNMAKATVVTAMDKSLYDQTKDSNGDFCEEGTFELTDAAATCTEIHEGDFEAVFNPDGGSPGDEPQPTIATVSPGVYRVTFPTGSIKEQFAGNPDEDEEAAAMLKQLFAGHTITMTVRGSEVVETNMTKAEDGKSATIVIPFDDLLAGSSDVPDEAYAVVKAE